MPADRIDITIEATNKTRKAFNQINKSAQGLKGAFSQAAGGASAFKAMKFSAVSQSMRTLGAPLKEFSNSIVETGANFKRQMAVVGALSSATEGDLKKLDKQAQELGRSTEHSAIAAGEGMEVLSRAGLNTGQVMNAIRPALNLATAEQVDLAFAAEQVANALKTFSLDASQADSVANAMHATAKNANVDLTSLGETFKMAGSNAALAGKSHNEVLALSGALGNVGIKGSVAGTGLKNFYLTLAKDKDKVKNAFGIDVEGKSTIQILEAMKGKLDGMTSKSDKLSLVMDVFGKIGGTSAGVLIEKLGDVTNLYDKLSNDNTALNDTVQAMADTTAGRMKAMESASKGFQLALFENSQGFTDLGIKAKTAFFNAGTSITEFSPLLGGLVGTAVQVGGGLATIGPALADIAVLSSSFGPLLKVFGRFGLMLGGLVLKTIAWTFALLANPVVLIVAALVAVAVLVYKYWDEIVGAFKQAWEWLSKIGSAIANFFGGDSEKTVKIEASEKAEKAVAKDKAGAQGSVRVDVNDPEERTTWSYQKGVSEGGWTQKSKKGATLVAAPG